MFGPGEVLYLLLILQVLLFQPFVELLGHLQLLAAMLLLN